MGFGAEVRGNFPTAYETTMVIIEVFDEDATASVEKIKDAIALLSRFGEFERLAAKLTQQAAEIERLSKRSGTP